MYKMYRFIVSRCCSVSFTTYAQTYKLCGKVTEATTGEALIGANVFVEETTWGAASDANGNYSMSVTRDHILLRVAISDMKKLNKKLMLVLI